MTFCPGYAAASRSRALRGGRPVQAAREPHLHRAGARRGAGRRDAEPRCGLLVVDLRTGDAVHWLRIEGVVEELYDVAVLPGVRRPMALGLKTDEIRRTITVGAPEAL